MFATLTLASDSPLLGDKVVQFARSKIGQAVGDGECRALAGEALRHAGARPPGPGRASWGDEVKSIKEVRPGDILVLEEAVFVRQQVRADGAIVTLTYRSPHHVAIASGIRGRGRSVVISVLQQNVGFEGASDAEKKVVQEGTVNMAELRSGTIRAFRPVAIDPPQ